MSDNLDELIRERERLWSYHPILEESAVLPTRPVQDAIARALLQCRKARASIAFWAQPLTGKTYCSVAMTNAFVRKFPGAGIVRMEPVDDRKSRSEGRLLTEILTAIDYPHKPDRDLAIKRRQVKHALIALSGDAGRLFFIIDEAQELTNAEFVWLKAVINGLANYGVKVMTVLFGQRELKDTYKDLQNDGRSDLSKRFMSKLLQFRGLCSLRDMAVICEAMDVKSEFPAKSGWSYTQYLFPRAFAAGFRLARTSALIWERMRIHVPPAMLSVGLSMDIIASFLANIAVLCKDSDIADFDLDVKIIDKALIEALKGS